MAVAIFATVTTLHMTPCNVHASKLTYFDAHIIYSCDMLIALALEPILRSFMMVTYGCSYIAYSDHLASY
jgi:hypothetical protein